MDRTLNSIFCDDIRQEVGNKLSYIGCYVGQLLVPQFPVVLPKLCVLMTAHTLASSPFKQLQFRLLKNDEVIAEFETPINENTPSIGPPASMGGAREELRQSVYQIFQLFPVPIEEPCKFRARAITDSGELRGGSLVVSLAETPLG